MWKLLILSLFIISASSAIKTRSVDQQKIVDRHNYYRNLLKIEPLEFSEELANFAQEYAEILAKKNNGLKHSKNNNYGENIYWFSEKSTEVQAVDAWASEQKYFNRKRKKFTSKAGHYTQIIWRKTKFVGAGMAIAKDGSEYWVCTYYPSGNWIGEKVY